MPAPAATLSRAIEGAAQAREGRDLFSWTTSSRLTFAANDPTVLTDVDVLKVGTYNGWTFTASDLEAMVEHFAMLTESETFRPPVRLDHSWSILQVVGYADALRTAIAVDPTTGQPTTYLRADLRMTEPLALDLIRRGTAVNRSSEVGPYETNLGTLYPLVFYGVAFVDIPAVEGLRPIQLSRRYGAPRSVTTLTDEGTPPMPPTATDPGQQTDPATGQATAGQTGDASTGSAAAGAPAGEGNATSTGSAGVAAPSTDGGATGSAPAADESPVEAELRQLREERATLRAEARDQDVARFREAGVIVDANVASATTLLGHEDAAVRTAARALLGSMRPPVELGRRVGQLGAAQTSTSTGVGVPAGSSINLSGKSPDEVGAWWAALERDQRREGTEESKAYAAWRAAQAG